MVISYNRAQKEIIDLKFHTYIYKILMNLGIDVNLIGTKYFFNIVVIAGSLSSGIFKDEFSDSDLSITNLCETLSKDINVSAKKIRSNIDYAFNNINMKIAKTNYAKVFNLDDEVEFDMKYVQAKELLRYLTDQISFLYRIQSNKYSIRTTNWVESLVIEDEQKRRETIEKLKLKTDNNDETK